MDLVENVRRQMQVSREDLAGRADERSALADMEKLAEVYLACLDRFFSKHSV